jgi:hypothetical protein
MNKEFQAIYLNPFFQQILPSDQAKKHSVKFHNCG